MANNIFTGIFYDENNNRISGGRVKYYGIHRNTSGELTITNPRIAEDDMYNFNLIDHDWLGNYVPFISGDQIAIIAWEFKDSLENSTELLRFGLIFFPQDGRDTYIQNIQLLPKQQPSCNLTFSNGVVGDVITFNSNSSDIYQWTYDGMLHHHRSSIFGHNTFAVGVSEIVYDYGAGWVSDNQHTFLTSGVYLVKTKTTNIYGLVANCEKEITVKFGSPVGCISFSDDEPFINDTIQVISCTTDPYGTITNIDHLLDNVNKGSSTNLTFSYDLHLPLNKQYEAKQVITWYDGFEVQTLIVTKTLTMSNIPPEFDLVVEELYVTTVTAKKLIANNIVDPDGDNSKVNIKWKIEFKTPIDDLFKVVYDPGYPNPISQTPLELEFTISGTYRITATAIDEKGGVTTKSTIIVINNECDEVTEVITECIRYIEWE